jgi:hypothetical protein
MITEDQLRAISNQLLEKSLANQAEWQKDDDPMAGGSCFELVLPKSIIRIVYHSPRTELDSVALHLCNANGYLVATLTAEEGGPDWPLLKKLHEEAHRHVTGWDEVIKDVQENISKPGKIGVGR